MSSRQRCCSSMLSTVTILTIILAITALKTFSLFYKSTPCVTVCVFFSLNGIQTDRSANKWFISAALSTLHLCHNRFQGRVFKRNTTFQIVFLIWGHFSSWFFQLELKFNLLSSNNKSENTKMIRNVWKSNLNLKLFHVCEKNCLFPAMF